MNTGLRRRKEDASADSVSFCKRYDNPHYTTPAE